MKTTRQEREAWINSDGDHLNRHAVRRLLEDFAELEAQLAACAWTPITETDLPKVGDEILAKSGHIIIFHEHDYEHRDFAMWNGYTHFRAINPPQQGKP